MRYAIIAIIVLMVVSACTVSNAPSSGSQESEQFGTGAGAPTTGEPTGGEGTACTDKCGDANCDKSACASAECPCLETEISCPEDCMALEIDSGITMDDLLLHSTAVDCWVVYEGKVYDVTDYISVHPGGPNAIAKYCGTTGFQEGFIKKHGTSKVEILLSETEEVGVFSG